jgi:hypothetical protein
VLSNSWVVGGWVVTQIGWSLQKFNLLACRLLACSLPWVFFPFPVCWIGGFEKPKYASAA